MEIYTVESDLLVLESKRYINRRKPTVNLNIFPKKGTNGKIRTDKLALSYRSENPLNIFYNLQKDHGIY